MQSDIPISWLSSKVDAGRNVSNFLLILAGSVSQEH